MARILNNGTWVLVADGEKALFLENEGDAEYPVLKVRGKETQANPLDREQSTSRPGRQHQSVGSARSAYEETDWHQLEKERFGRHLAELLYDHAEQQNFARIILVAAPEVLAAIRAQLHQTVTERVVAEIPKTLTNHPIPEIERVLKAEFDPV
ncbi:host attachment family protein [Paracoccus litorisediminis]|uniref:host attachment family protein n=1 Tax=Paracoccus litorisediminis TaxID=2006130 RepID=UPI0031B5B09C